MFGTNSSNLFGSSTNTGLFGTQTQSQQAKPSLFGTTQPAQQSAGLFGGQNAGGSLFTQGTAQPQQQSSLFGAQPAVVGTTVKFVPITATDTMLKNGMSNNINTRNMCITAMKEYQNKSLEELRLEDYIAGRKSGQSSMMFGQQQQQTSTGASSLFNKQNEPATGGLFNSAFNAKPTGTTQASGIFTQKTGLFNNASTVTPVSSSAGGLFQTQPKTSLFNPATSQTGTGNLFNTGANTGSSLFQNSPLQTQQSQAPFSTGFNTQSSATPFNTFKTTTTQQSFFTNKPTFGQTTAAPTGTGLFQTQAQPAQQLPIFGQNQNAQPFSGGSSLFQPNQQASTLPGIGGAGGFNTQAIGGGLFQQQASSLAPAAAVSPVSAVVTLSSRARQDIIEAQLAALPYGDSPLLKPSLKSEPTSPKEAKVKRSFPRFLAAATTSTTTSNTSPIMSTEISRQSTTSSLPKNKPTSTNGSLDTSALMNNSFTYRSIVSDLAAGRNSSLIQSPRETSVRNRSLLVQEGDRKNGDSLTITIGVNGSNRSTRRLKALDVSVIQREDLNGSSYLDINTSPSAFTPSTKHVIIDSPEKTADNEDRSTTEKQVRPTEKPLFIASERQNIESTEFTPKGRPLYPTALHSSNSPVGLSGAATGSSPANSPASPTHSAASPVYISSASFANASPASRSPATRLEGYYSQPTADELRSMRKRDGLYHIDCGLTVGRKGHGSVFWQGPMTLPDINFEQLVHFRPREICVYPDETKKPPVGEGLNQRARVTLENIWPLDKNKKTIMKPEELVRLRFRERLMNVCKRMNAEFCDYDPATGVWTFIVDHFSRYGYYDEEYDNEAILANSNPVVEEYTRPSGRYYVTQEELDGTIDLDVSRPLPKKVEFEPKIVEKEEEPMEQTLLRNAREPVYEFHALEREFVQSAEFATFAAFPFRRSCRVSFGRGPTLVAAAEPGGYSTTVKLMRIQPAICFETILEDFLSANGRLQEINDLKSAGLVQIYPTASAFVKLIDSYILQSSEDPEITHKLALLCHAVILKPSPTIEICQRINFGNWLRKMLRENFVESRSTDPFQRIYQYLLWGAVRKAVECARDAHLYELALLISFYTTTPGTAIQGQVEKQLKFHNKIGVPQDKIHYQRILQLLSGSWSPSADDCNLTWMNCFGVICWYYAKPSTTLAECVDLYNKLFN